MTRLFAIFAIASITAGAAEPVWPPATDAARRLEDLRAVLMSATSTPAERQAAREETMKMIVNEYRLNLGTPEAQQFLLSQMEEYFFGTAAGLPPDFVAPHS